MSMLGFLNFIPKTDMASIMDVNECVICQHKQEIMLSTFVATYRGLESAKINFEGKPINSGEAYDKGNRFEDLWLTVLLIWCCMKKC